VFLGHHLHLIHRFRGPPSPQKGKAFALASFYLKLFQIVKYIITFLKLILLPFCGLDFFYVPDKLQFIALFNNEPRMVRVKIASNFYSHSGTGKNDSELSNRTVIGKISRLPRQPEGVQRYVEGEVWQEQKGKNPEKNILKRYFSSYLKSLQIIKYIITFLKFILLPFCGLDFFYVPDKLQFTLPHYSYF